MKRFAAVPVVSLIAVVMCGAAGPEPAARPVQRTHAHNDYLHPRPLLDALQHGFVSVEADVFLVGAELRVAHDPQKDWSRVPTLEDAYLSPLARLRATHGNGGVYADGSRLLLLIDFKSDGPATYARLHEVLVGFEAAHPGLFTRYDKAGNGKWKVTRGAVDVVISGSQPPRAVTAAQAVRYAGHDGRQIDIGPDVKPEDAPELVPLISDNWQKVFVDALAWDGTGEMPADTHAQLKTMVDAVHAEGKLLRFWGLPKDAPGVWGPLHDAGVDLINTDDLRGLSTFLREKRPH